MSQLNTIYEIGDKVWGITLSDSLVYGTLVAMDYLEYLDTKFLKQSEMVYTIESPCDEIHTIINTIYGDRDSALIKSSELVEPACHQR